MSNNYAPYFNRIGIVVIPSYIELPWFGEVLSWTVLVLEQQERGRGHWTCGKARQLHKISTYFSLIRNGFDKHNIFKFGSIFDIKLGISNSEFLSFLLIVLRFLPEFGIMGDSNVLFLIVLVLEQYVKSVVTGHVE